MSKLAFSPRVLFPLLAAAILSLGILACAASAPEDGAAEPAPTQPVAPRETDEEVGEPPTLSAILSTPSGGGGNPTALPATQFPTTVPPTLPERRYLTLEYPPRMRAGDSDIIRLTLEVDDLGNITPTAEIEGNVVTGKVIEIPNLYETHQVIVESRFDVAGMEVRPSELISAPISEGQTAVFYWSIRPDDVGFYRGTIWLYLRFVDKSSGEESQKMVSAQVVEIEAVNLLGFSANTARATGMVGSVLGTILGFPFFEDVLKLLLRKFGRKI
jgi:hypothetical protein